MSTQGSSPNPAPFGTIITTVQQSLSHSEHLVDVGRLSSAELERQQFEQEEDEWYFGDRTEGKDHSKAFYTIIYEYQPIYYFP